MCVIYFAYAVIKTHAKLLNTYFLSNCFAASSTPAPVILYCYCSIHKYISITKIVKFLRLLAIYVLSKSSFISTQFVVLNLVVELAYYPIDLLFFAIPLLYCYINLRSSMNFCLFFWDIFLFYDIFLCLFWFVLFEAVLAAYVAYYLARSINFWLCLPLRFLLIFLPMFLLLFSTRDKNP